MSTSHGSTPTNHRWRCESAESPGCRCKCDGMLHQRDVLVAAFESRKTQVHFDEELTKLFGSAFASLSAAPVPPQKNRRGKWTNMASAGKAKHASQIEQRVVDVTLRDLLQIVHAMPRSAKAGWMPFLNALTAKPNWQSISSRVEAVAGHHDKASGFFWASMLASASGTYQAGTSVSVGDITAFPASVSTVFDEARHPRARSGNTVSTIKEMTFPAAVSIAANPIASAWSTTVLSASAKATVLAVVGSAVSSDLWRHPAAVRYLLLPAVSGIRSLVPTASFSLDSAIQPVEDAIDTELAAKWRAGGVW